MAASAAKVPRPVPASPSHLRIPTVTVAGIPICAYDMDSAIADVLTRAIDGSAPKAYRVVGAFNFPLVSSDGRYGDLSSGTGITFVDGKPVAFFAAKSRLEPIGHVRGPSFFERCLDEG